LFGGMVRKLIFKWIWIFWIFMFPKKCPTQKFPWYSPSTFQMGSQSVPQHVPLCCSLCWMKVQKSGPCRWKIGSHCSRCPYILLKFKART
jgi:hypothetical protein